MRQKYMIYVSLVALGIVLLVSCRSHEAEKITNIPEESKSRMTGMVDTTGFQKAWIDYDSIAGYDKVMVEVTVSNNKIENSAFDNLNTRKMISSEDDDLKYLTGYVNESFEKAFKKSSGFKLVTVPGDNVLEIDFVITQVIPNDAVVSTASFVAGCGLDIIFMPVGIALQSVGDSNRGAIAAEVLIKDSLSGEMVSAFADREKGPVTILFNTNDFTTYGNVRSIIDTWTEDIVSVLDQVKSGKRDLQPAEKVELINIIE